MTAGEDNKRNRERGNGLGSIRTLPNGKVQWSITVGYDANGKQRRKTGTEKNDTAAKKAMAAALTAHARGLLAPPERITLGEWLDRWLEGRKPHVGDTTYELYETRVRLYIPEKLKKMRLQDVKRTHLKQLELELATREAVQRSRNGKERKLGRPLSVASRAKVFEHLRAAFEEAIEQEYLTVNPARGMRAKATEAEKSKRNGKRKALTDEEMDKFLTAAEGDPLFPVLYTLFSLGVRRGEALGLRWSDINFKTGAVRIEQQVKQLQNKPVIGSLKTERSCRTLTASEDLLEVLAARRASQAVERKACGAQWQEHGLVFTTTLGTPVSPRNVNRTITRLCEKAGVRHFGSHTGRYTNITNRLRGGEKLEVVSKIAGHARASITVDLYRDVLDEETRGSVYSIKEQRGRARPAPSTNEAQEEVESA